MGMIVNDCAGFRVEGRGFNAEGLGPIGRDIRLDGMVILKKPTS